MQCLPAESQQFDFEKHEICRIVIEYITLNASFHDTRILRGKLACSEHVHQLGDRDNVGL